MFSQLVWKQNDSQAGMVLQGGGALWCVRCLSVAGCGRNSLVESQAQVCHLSALMGRLSIQLRGHTRILTPPHQCLTHTHTHAQGKVQVCDSNVTVIFPVWWLSTSACWAVTQPSLLTFLSSMLTWIKSQLSPLVNGWHVGRLCVCVCVCEECG